MRKRLAFTLVILAVAALGGAGYAALRASKPFANVAAADAARPAFTEVKWPFLMDQWGTGRAFTCKAVDCGADVNLYVRPKLGFCNCTTGVADDEEIDRIGDVDLLGNTYAPRGPGRPVTVGWMKGRSRPYRVAASPSSSKSAMTIAFSDKCDVIVATIVASQELPANTEQAALDFLSGNMILRWAEVTLGL